MSIDELEKYATLPKDKRTVVEDLAYKRVVAAQKSLPDVREIADRTEGKAVERTRFTNADDDDILPPTIIYTPKPLPNDYDDVSHSANNGS